MQDSGSAFKSAAMRVLKFLFAIAVGTVLACGSCRAQPRASVGWAPEYDETCGYNGDGTLLTVTDGGRVLVTMKFCSAYGGRDVAVVSDARGRHYVLLEHAENHGTHVIEHFLTVYRLTSESLVQCERLQIYASIGLYSSWSYDYRAESAPEGGIRLMMRLRKYFGEGDSDDFDDLRKELPPDRAVIHVRESSARCSTRPIV